MSNEIILNADLRVRTGTNKTREIRREDSMVPAIIYGNEEESKNIKLKLNELTKASENELFYTQVLKILLEGNEEKVVLKELQREPVKGKFLHADFQRVSRKTKLKVVVPFRFNGEEECQGVKTDGGVIAKAISEIEIACLAGDIPEAIEVDITNLMLNEAIRLSDITLPEGAEIPGFDEENDQMIVSVNPPRAEEEEPEILPEGEEGEEGEVAEGEETSEEQDASSDDAPEEDKSSD
jgi:large subunit ribosomal protein L25